MAARWKRIIPHLQPGRAHSGACRWDGDDAGASSPRCCRARGMGGSHLTVLEAMGGPRERAARAPCGRFDLHRHRPAEHDRARSRRRRRLRAIIAAAPGLPDDLFEHDGQLTKRDMRARDAVGAGAAAGRTAVGRRRRLRLDRDRMAAAPSLAARDRHRARPGSRRRTARNALALGVPDLQVVVGRGARRRSRALPRRTRSSSAAAFATGRLRCRVVALKPGGRLVVNAVTLEGEARLAELFRVHGGELLRLAVRACRAGRPLARLAAGDAGHAMAGDQAMIALGVGCRATAPGGAISQRWSRRRCALAVLSPMPSTCIATEDSKAAEPGLVEAAAPSRPAVASALSRRTLAQGRQSAPSPFARGCSA